MPESISKAICEAVAEQLRDALLPIDGVDVQIERGLVWRPTPPTIDVFPAAQYQTQITFGVWEAELNLTVRARVGTPDQDAAQDLLYELSDPVGDLSIPVALMADRTLGSTVSDAQVISSSGFGTYPLADGSGDLLGMEWALKVTP